MNTDHPIADHLFQRCSRLRAALLTPGVLSALIAGAACAQDRIDSTDSWVLDEVVVTGRRESFTATETSTGARTPTPIERLPQSVQILTRTLLEEQALQTISDALVNVSGVTPSSTMQTVLVAPYVRGFASSYYFDGLPTFQLPPSAADPATLLNVSRIEVAKGPTATLYGGGSGAPLAGLINVVSRDPDPAFTSEFAVRGGSDATLGAQGRISAPLNDAVALALAGMYEEADSFIHEVSSERYALFPTLAWSIDDATQLKFRGQFSRLRQLEYSGLPVRLVGRVDRNAYAGANDAPQTEVENAMATLELNHAFGPDAAGTLVVRRFENTFDEYSTFPLAAVTDTAYSFGRSYMPTEVEQTFVSASAWKDFASTNVRHRVLAGIDYDDTDYYGAMGLDYGWAVVDYADPATNAAFGAIPAVTEVQTNALRSAAVFVQEQLTIGRLDIIAGLRWTQLEMDNFYSSAGFPIVDREDDPSKVTPRLGVAYQLTRGVALFVGYAEGFKGTLLGIGVEYPKPETSASIEGGVKFAAPIEGLTGTVAAYEIKRRNVTTSDPNNPGRSIQSGEQRARGFEVDLVYEPSAAVSTLFSYAYTDAEVTRDNRLPVGDRLRAVPEHRARLAARYRFQGGALAPLELGAGITYTSERELTLPNTSTVDSLTLIDAQASWDFGLASLALSIVNLADDDGFEPYQFFGGQYVIPTQPRAAFLTLHTELR